ncbi:carboxypeptidase M isoform X2 [Corythoichthys intestinalis]|nr:carboxypeptidase M isoform X2 [Corythoichthys intestinalis]XP_061809602.1 carboxypeptidase M-like [Nerophis lumbriciformis]
MSRLFLIIVTVGVVVTLDFRYHGNKEMEHYLLRVNASNPDIAHLYSIGRSVAGQELWVLALGQSSRRHTVGIPEFKYVANMHGNEVVGRELLLHLTDDLVRGYRGNKTWSVRILNSTRVHFLPTMNPDGFDQADTSCYLGQGRFNRNGVDLNRNFPDAFAERRNSEEAGREAEVRAVMGWLRTETFVLSANLHGGALVASYAYDNSDGGGELVGGASLTPDDDVFVHLAKVYSHNHANMRQGEPCGDQPPFRDGITNGYRWYPLAGGMQDYNYVWAQCLEVTLEVSCCKFPPADRLPVLWTDNRKSLLAFMRQIHLGVKGRVLDGSGAAAPNAAVEVTGRHNIRPFKTDKRGEYYRLLLPGNYTFTVTFPGHEILTESFWVPYGPDGYSALTHDFLLRRIEPSSARPSSPGWALGLTLALLGTVG